MPDLYKLGQPLGRRGLFQLVSDEAFRDGKLDPSENEILGTLAKFLRIDGELARSIAKMSMAKFRAGAFAEARPLDPVRLFREILRHVYSDNKVDEKELAMLAGMQKLLQLTDEDRRKLEAEVRAPDEAAPAGPSARVQELVAEVAILAGGEALAAAARIATEASSSAIPDADRASWVTVAAGLGPVLARGGKWRELEALWKAIATSGALHEDSADAIGRAFEELVDVRIANGPLELVPGAVSIAERFARLEPADPYRWIALGAASHKAVRACATAGRFALVEKIVRALDGIPPDAGEAQGHHAEALTSWGILAMKASAADQVHRASDAMAALAARVHVPEVVRARANLLGCAVEWWCASAKDPGPAGASLSALHSLVEEHGDDAAVAQSFSLCSEFALMLVLILQDVPGATMHLTKVRLVSGAHVGDEDVQFAFARAMVNAAVQVKGMDGIDEPTRASLLTNLEQTLAVLAGACPRSARLKDAKERFDRVKAQRSEAPEPPVAATGPVPEDVSRMRTLFDSLQAGRLPPAAAYPLLELVGTGGYPRRVKQEGEGVYAADEPYFLHMLAELERQLGFDRVAFWKQHAPQLELVLRYMVEDATPAIAQAARRVQRIAGFDEA